MNSFIIDFACVFLCIVAFLFAYKFYKQNKFKQAILLIVFIGLILRIYAGSDLYLHTWDERYHALVAKNLMSHPLTPTLYDNAVLPYHYQDWISNHVWFEKPPIPLWSIAVSLKIFGINEIAVRIPSLVLSSLAILLTFLIGTLLFNNKVGLIAAFLHSINGLLIELAAGQVSSDHVETSFLFFVELAVLISVYAIKKKKSYLFSTLIGFVTAISLLCKWNPGLIVLPVWFFGAYFSKKYTFKELFRNTVLIFLTILFISGSWVTYILIQFPEEAKWVLAKFVLAYSHTVEGHQAPFYNYLNEIRIVFGELIYIPILLSVYFLFRKKISWQMAMLTAWWLIPLLVFSFAETKRQTYILLFAPAFFILIAYYWFYLKYIRNKVKYKYVLNIVLILLLLLPIRFCFERLKFFQQRDRNPLWSKEIKNIKNKIPSGKNVIVFNIDRPIETMFYNDCIAYPQLPDVETIAELQQKGFTVILNENEMLKQDFYKKSEDVLIVELLSSEGD